MSDLEIPFEGPSAEMPEGSGPDGRGEALNGCDARGAQAPSPAIGWKMLIYGTPGVGKSTLTTYAPTPYFLDLEGGLRRIVDPKRRKIPTSLDDLVGIVRRFAGQETFRTLVIDTIDELERMLAAKVLADWNRKNKPEETVSDIPYGRGTERLIQEWRGMIDLFEAIVETGKNVLLTGHESVVKFENPTDANYDFYAVNLNKRVAPIVTAKLDAVLFAQFETVVRGGERDKKGKASSTGERILRAQQGSSWVAKNRFNLPDVLPLDKNLFDLIK